MAAACFAAGHYSDAMSWARNAIGRSPEHPPAYFFLIAAAAMRGDLASAADALARLRRLQPEFSLAWMRENMAYSEEVGERLLEGLRKAGMPEE